MNCCNFFKSYLCEKNMLFFSIKEFPTRARCAVCAKFTNKFLYRIQFADKRLSSTIRCVWQFHDCRGHATFLSWNFDRFLRNLYPRSWEENAPGILQKAQMIKIKAQSVVRIRIWSSLNLWQMQTKKVHLCF